MYCCFYWVKTNVTHGPSIRFVSNTKLHTMGFFYEISKRHVREHSTKMVYQPYSFVQMWQRSFDVLWVKSRWSTHTRNLNALLVVFLSCSPTSMTRCWIFYLAHVLLVMFDIICDAIVLHLGCLICWTQSCRNNYGVCP